MRERAIGDTVKVVGEGQVIVCKAVLAIVRTYLLLRVRGEVIGRF